MLVVKNFIAPSKIPNAGIGCFSKQYIKKNDIVFQYDEDLDIIVTKEKYDSFSDNKKYFFDYYASLEKDFSGNTVLMLSADNSKYINHSDDPNLLCTDLNTIVAKNDIIENEELTLDYRTIDENMKNYNGPLEEYFEKHF